MNINIFPTREEASLSVAQKVLELVQLKPHAVLGLPTGQTPIELYRILVETHRKKHIDLGQITTFNLDEFLGLADDHPASFRAFMRTHFFDPIQLPFDQTFFPTENNMHTYDEMIQKKGGLDLTILGIGMNGHIGFNEPGSPRTSRTRRILLTEESRKAYPSHPSSAITVGIQTVLESRSIILMAFGQNKAGIVQKLIQSTESEDLPASLLKSHAHFEVFLDREAAAAIDQKNRP